MSGDQPFDSSAAVLGVGVDLVHIPEFREQLGQPGTRLATAGQVFTSIELADAADGPLADEVHLAARWAAKEALIKAWSASIYGSAPVSSETEVYRFIEVVRDAWDRPRLRLTGQVAEHLGTYSVQVSLSHDGDYAIGYVVICR